LNQCESIFNGKHQNMPIIYEVKNTHYNKNLKHAVLQSSVSQYERTFSRQRACSTVYTEYKLYGRTSQRSRALLLGGGVLDEINNTVRVAVLIVIPTDKFDKVVIEGKSSFGIKGGAHLTGHEVSRD